MNPEFWNERWREGKIGFHEGKPNDHLVTYHARLGANRRVLVPLCGKTEDLAYLASLGHRVAGVELVEEAVRAFFDEHGFAPAIRRTDTHAVYTHDAITIVAGDFFAVTPELLGPTDALWDRAALVALPPELRPRYIAHVRSLVAPRSPALVVNFIHDGGSGPPFSVPDDEVRAHFGEIELLAERPDTQGRDAIERAWAITL